MRVLITGATGFVGQRTCRRMSAAGHFVRAAVRDPAGGSALPDSVERVVVGDVAQVHDWNRALDGMDAVVYLAARVHRTGERDADAAYDAVNCSAAVRMAEAAASRGVRRFLYLSSIKVSGESTHGEPFSDCRAAPADAYARSKHRAEQALMKVADESALSVIVLRAPLVYGPGVGANFLRLMRLVEQGKRLPLPLGSVHNERSLIFVENLADAIVTATARASQSSCYPVADPDPMSVPDLMRCLGDCLDTRPRLVPFPVSMLRLAGRFAGRAEVVRRLTDSLVVDPTRFMRDFQWRPPFTTQAGLLATCWWFQGLTSRGVSAG